MKRPGNSKYVKELNRMNIVNLIKKSDSISRQEIAEVTGLTPAAVSGIIRELMEVGLVREEGLGESQGGRRPVNLAFNATAGYVIGVEVTSQEILWAIGDLQNAPLETHTVKQDMCDPASAMIQLVTSIRSIINDKENQNKKFVGIALAFPAIFMADGKRVKRAINLGEKWDGFPLIETLQEQLKLPVFAETNAKVAALGERWFGGGTWSENLIYINMGEGISAGIIMGDQIVQGAHGYAGQIGHTIIQEQGALCKCGNRGCLETVCGLPALVRKVAAEIQFIDEMDAIRQRFDQQGKIDANDILAIAAQEESYARDVVRQAARHVAVVTASLINFYNPGAVFIGGKSSRVAGFFIEEFRDIVSARIFPGINEMTTIAISRLGANSGVVGACALALKNLLHSPESAIFAEE